MRTLLIYSILNHSAFAGSRVGVSLGGLELKASPFAIGLILSFYSLLPMFLSVAGGRFVDRAGLRLPMLGGALLLSLGVAMPFLVWDIAALFLASVLIGLGFMSFHLCMQKAAGDLGGDAQRKANFSLLALGFSISGFVGPTGAGVLIDAIGHRATFAVLALLPLVASLGLLRYPFSERLPHRPPAIRPGSEPGRVTDLLREPELKRLYVSVALLSSAWDVHQFLVPLYGAALGLSASKIGLVLGCFAVATFVVRLAMPILSRYISEWPLIVWAMATAAAVYAVYPFFPSLSPMLALSFALGLGLGCAQPMVLAVLHRASPAGRVGEAAGLRLTLVNGTQTFLPTAFGALGGAFGLAPLFWGLAAMVGAGAVYAGRQPSNPGHPAHAEPGHGPHDQGMP